MRAPSKRAAYLRGAVLARSRAVVVSGAVRADRLPLIRRKHPAARLELADRVRLFRDVAFYLRSERSRVSIGPRTYVGRRTEFHCDDRIEIGSDCAISWDVQFIDSDQHRIEGGAGPAPIVVGDHVWVGQRVTVLKGVTVGDGAVLAAGSVVTRDVPAATVVAGVPARVIRESVTWS